MGKLHLKASASGGEVHVYLEDEDNTVYDIEMQCLNTKELPERTRYYHSLIDQDLLEKGEPYGSMKNVVIIFICMFDLFGKGLWQYTFQSRAEECPEILLDDGQKTIFVNAGGVSEDPDVQNFLDYLNGSKPKGQDAFVKTLEDAFESALRNSKWRCEYMYAVAREQSIHDAGRAEGRAEERRSNIRAMIAAGIPQDQVKAILKLTDEDIDQAFFEKE